MNQPKLKVGDTFIYTDEMDERQDKGRFRLRGEALIQEIECSGNREYYIVDFKESFSFGYMVRCDIVDDLIKTNQFFMTNLLEKFKMALKTEPDKSLIETGVTNIDGKPTSEGIALFHNWLFEKYKAEFAKDVLPALKEDK